VWNQFCSRSYSDCVCWWSLHVTRCYCHALGSSDVVTNFELREHSEVFFPPLPFILLSFLPLSPPLPCAFTIQTEGLNQIAAKPAKIKCPKFSLTPIQRKHTFKLWQLRVITVDQTTASNSLQHSTNQCTAGTRRRRVRWQRWTEKKRGWSAYTRCCNVSSVSDQPLGD